MCDWSKCSSILSLHRPKCTPSRAPPRYLVLRSQKWSRHNRNNFNTHFIDSKPCKSMHLVKLKLIQGNIIPIRIFHQCCKSSNEPSSTITVMHCSTAAHHVQVYTHSLNLPYSKYSPWLSLFYSQTSGYNGDCSFHGRDGLKATIWGTWVNFSDMVTWTSLHPHLKIRHHDSFHHHYHSCHCCLLLLCLARFHHIFLAPTFHPPQRQCYRLIHLHYHYLQYS